MKTRAPKWAVNAANRFVIPTREAVVFDGQILPPHKTIDVEKLHAALLALQLRAYRRGQREVDTAAMNRESARNRKAAR